MSDEMQIIPAQGIEFTGLTHSEGLAKFAEAMAGAQGQMEAAKKDSANPFFKSKYADLAAVISAIRGPLSAVHIAHVQCPGVDEEGEFVDTMLIHASGEWVRGRIRMKPVKADPQGIGSVITYMRRYALQAMVGLEADDDDGNHASAKGDQPRQAQHQSEPTPRSLPPTKPLPEGSYSTPPTSEKPVSTNPGANTSPSVSGWKDRVLHVGKSSKGKRLGDLPDSVTQDFYDLYKNKDCKTKDDNLLKAALLLWKQESDKKNPLAAKEELMAKLETEKVPPMVFGEAVREEGLIDKPSAADYNNDEAAFALQNWDVALAAAKARMG